METVTKERLLGRVLRSSTTSLTVGCRTLEADIPVFGSLVQAERADGSSVYGLIHDVRVDDDPFVRQLIAAGDLSEEYVQDQRQRRQVPVEVAVLVVGGRSSDGRVFYVLPPQPPATLSWVSVCSDSEVRQFGEKLAFVRTVLNATDAPGDDLLPAALSRIAAVQGSTDLENAYLVRAGQELARLLSRDPMRLDGVLQRMR